MYTIGWKMRHRQCEAEAVLSTLDEGDFVKNKAKENETWGFIVYCQPNILQWQ